MDQISAVAPLFIVIISFIYASISGLYFYFFLALGMIISSFISESIKKIVPKKGIFLRPTDQPCKCKYPVPKCKNMKEVGFPSTHAFVMTFFAIMVLMYHKKINSQVIISLILAIVIMIQRYTSFCHSLLQISTGASFGSIFGVLYYNFISV